MEKNVLENELDDELDKVMKKDELERELEKIYKLMYKFAFSKLKNKEDTEDVISETAYICVKEIDKLKDKNKFKFWALSILNNECKRFYRQNKNNEELYDKAKENLEIADYSIENAENRTNFEELIKDLKEDEKEIFRMYFYENYTLDEISKMLNLKKNTVKSKLRRGKEKLRTFINRNKKKFAFMFYIIILLTSGIAIAATIIASRYNSSVNYEVSYKNDDVNAVEYSVEEDKFIIKVDFSENINEENFNVYWKNDSVYLINSNKNMLYAENLEWTENNTLEMIFKYGIDDLDSNLILHIIPLEGNSVTIMLKK